MNIYEATEIWSSVEYGNGGLRNREFVESEVAHAEINRLNSDLAKCREEKAYLEAHLCFVEEVTSFDDFQKWKKAKAEGTDDE